MKKLVQCLALTLLVSAPAFGADKTATSDTTAPTNNTATTTTTADANATTTTKAKAMSMSNVLMQLQKAGYIVKNVDYSKDDGIYKVEAVDRHGEKQSLEINAATGLTPEQKKVPHEVSIAQAVKKLEKNGAMVTSISADTTGYKATVMDSKGNQQDYTVDLATGKVSQ